MQHNRSKNPIKIWSILKKKSWSINKTGQVILNGKQAIIGGKADYRFDHFLVEGKGLPKRQNFKVFLLNKHYWFISICHDNHRRKKVLNLIPSNSRQGIHPVGRLD